MTIVDGFLHGLHCEQLESGGSRWKDAVIFKKNHFDN